MCVLKVQPCIPKQVIEQKQMMIPVNNLMYAFILQSNSMGVDSGYIEKTTINIIHMVWDIHIISTDAPYKG